MNETLEDLARKRKVVDQDIQALLEELLKEIEGEK